MELIGPICVGLVWGWLADHLHRPATRSARSLTVLLLATATAGAYHGWRLGLWGALLFVLATAFGAIIEKALAEAISVQERRGRDPASH